MLYFLIESLGWLLVVFLLIVMIVLYIRLHQQLATLRQNMTQLQAELRQHKDSVRSLVPSQPPSQLTPQPSECLPPELASTDFESLTTTESVPRLDPETSVANSFIANQQTNQQATENSDHLLNKTPALQTRNKFTSTSIEPDERSLPMVTSLFNSINNWFLGGNLVVRVGVLVFLVGIVLLLRLLSEYIEIPIALKLAVIGGLGLGLAGLGLKLVTKRFAYGITLQGTGLAIAYLSTFFAYSVYHVISSLPSFIMLGVLSAVTVALAVRQNAFPLALLALSGGFFAPILTSQDTGSLTALFSYYLLLNITIAAIAHYRPWKVLNLLGVTVTFGLAYYWGAESLTTVIENQRWSLILLVALHWLLYLFVVIRYAQQIIAYNANYEASYEDIQNAETYSVKQSNVKQSNVKQSSVNRHADAHSSYLFPIDIGLLFSVPILAFGLFSALMNDIDHALTITSAILAAIYLGLGWLFIQRSQRYALITEGMLALGGGFLALVIPLALDAEWIAFGWSVQGLALVWFGRRSLRAWSVLFGLLLQLISVAQLLFGLDLPINNHPTLALTISAMSALATAFILRANNSPIASNKTATGPLNSSHALDQHIATDSLSEYADALGINTQATSQWLATINNQSSAFKLVWQSPVLIRFLTLIAMGWSLYVLVIDVDQWLASWQLATTTLIALASLVSIIIYHVVNHYRSWYEIRQFSHGLLLLFYTMLVLQLPQKYEFNYQWTTFHWPIFTILLLGWLVVGQYWIKTWHEKSELKGYDSASWLGSGIIVLAELVHYRLPDSKGVVTILVPIVLMLAGLWWTHRHNLIQSHHTPAKNTSSLLSLYWFDWQEAILNSAKIFVPLTLCWVIFTNFTYDGVIWGLPYFPLFNLYDVTLWLIVFYGLGVYLLRQAQGKQLQNILDAIPKNNTLLIILALIAFWICSSMLVRTLHAFINTPLWVVGFYESTGGAWNSEQVQTGLTILWTLLALVATIIASRYLQRALWFMGIGLLGIVVLKLVLVDLSQTEAIWRVISFLGAGSLILLIGYLAPLPPALADSSNDDNIESEKD